ncbi:MAG TPA: hypothetical protein VGR35_21830 [Tepidisphaeraceae bacterium]|nr:hypothetical protein [Tepidisphaeraceae bacterium]
MAKQATTKRPDQPSEPVQRRPTDALWFAVLFVSVATGIGMTIFAPVGDEPPPSARIGTIGTVPATAPADPFITPATSPTTTTTTTTSPASL